MPGRSDCNRCPTRPHCVADGLAPDDLNALTALMRFGTVYGKGQHLFGAGDSVRGQFHVRSGVFKSYFISASGQESVTGFYWPGDVVPDLARDGRHGHWAVALEDSSACLTRFGATAAQEAGTAHARALQAINRHSQQMASRAIDHQLTVKTCTAEARVAGFCLATTRHLAQLRWLPDQLPTPMTRTDIASYLGLTLESLSRAISRLKQRGIIAASRQQIEIRDRPALELLAGHQH